MRGLSERKGKCLENEYEEKKENGEERKKREGEDMQRREEEEDEQLGWVLECYVPTVTYFNYR